MAELPAIAPVRSPEAPLGMFDVLLGSSPRRRWADGPFDNMKTRYIAAHP
ncbi:hypothetical protein ACLQ3H_24470 [Micromonospora saelicesensis]|nr:hypothetical protein [Micromonospora saelicesensis]